MAAPGLVTGMTTRTAALAACLLGTLTGCTSPGELPAPAAAASPPPGAVAIDCAHQIGNAPPRADFTVVLDAVAFPRDVLEPVRLPDGHYWAKTGLVVRTGVAVDVIVAPEAAGGALIRWGNPGTPATHQWVPACPGTGWNAFAGGYTTEARECLPLIMRAGGREARTTVGVGEPC
jgi:hypothetical protein